MAEIEKNTPAWLKAQIEAAEKAVPVATPLPSPGVDLAGQDEVYQEELVMIKSKKKTKKAPKKESDFHALASELADMLTDKNRKYGDSYARMAHVLPIFYPDGVPGEHLLDAVFILRIVDKLMRISSAQKDDDEDAVADIAGYAILRMREMRNNG